MSNASSSFESSSSQSEDNENERQFMDINFQNILIESPTHDIIKSFTTQKGAKARKDYLIISLIRSVKRAIKTYRNGRIPTSTAIQVDPLCREECKNWELIVTVLNTHSEVFEVMFPGRRNLRETNYNSRYFREFFSSAEVRDLYLAIVRLIYSEPQPQRLIEKFGFLCCRRQDDHTIECSIKWTVLQEYLNGEFLTNILAEGREL